VLRARVGKGHAREQHRIGVRIGDALLEARPLCVGVAGKVAAGCDRVHAPLLELRGHLVLEGDLDELIARHGNDQQLLERRLRQLRGHPA